MEEIIQSIKPMLAPRAIYLVPIPSLFPCNPFSQLSSFSLSTYLYKGQFYSPQITYQPAHTEGNQSTWGEHTGSHGANANATLSAPEVRIEPHIVEL